MRETKVEVAGVVFAKLRPSREDVFADIGCGNGGIAEFFAPHVAKVFAVDIDAEMVEKCRERVGKYDNVEVLEMHGLEFLKRFSYDLVFLGGTKDVESMLEVAAKKARRVVVNAARIEVATRVAEKMRELGIFKEVLIVNISKSYDLAGGTAFRSLNPVFVVFGAGDCASRPLVRTLWPPRSSSQEGTPPH